MVRHLDVALINTPYEQDVEHHTTMLVLKTKEYFIYEHIYMILYHRFV